MKHIVALMCLLAAATARAESSGRALQQSLSPFWYKERRISNESVPYDTDVVPHSTPTFRASAFGGCTGPLCPTTTDLIAYRLCFASQDATVTISTVPGRRSTYFDTQLYVFSVKDDAPPQREDSVSADAWDPPYDQFFASPVIEDEYFDDNSGAICSSDANATVDICTAPGAGCEPQPFGIKCPPGSLPRLLSKVEFQMTHGFGRPFKCMYAVIGAKDAPAGTDTLELGLLIKTTAPRGIPGSSPGNPRIGPFDILDLGIGSVPPATSAEPLIEPAWLSLSQAVAVGCDSESCRADKDFGEEASAPMFVYTNLCLEQAADGEQSATVRTRYGGSGPTDTTLFVYNEARSVSEWNDAGATRCSDGSEPSKDNCGPERVCRDEHEKCAGEDVKLLSMSEVEVPIPQGVGPTCFNAGVGAREGMGDVVNIGVDVILFGTDGKPAGTLNITTEVLPNGTIATTTTTTNPDGTTSTSLKLVDPFSTAPAAVEPAAVGPAAAEPAAVGAAPVEPAAVGPAAAVAPSASAVALGSADEILGATPPSTPPPPPASPDAPVYVYASAVDAIMGGMFRGRRRALMGAAQESVLRMGHRGGPAPGHPGSFSLPRAGPASALDLGAGPVAVGAQPVVIAPVWLDVQPAAAAGAAADIAAGLPPTSRMFVYEHVCFQRPPLGEASATVKTVHGLTGPRRVRLLLSAEGRAVPAHDSQQTLRRRCSDGARPGPHLCGGGTCAALDDMCVAEERVVTEAEVAVTVAAGVGQECFNLAVVVGDAEEGPALVGLALESRMRTPRLR